MIKTAKEFLGEKYFSSLNITYLEDSDKSLLQVSRNDKEVVIKYGQLSSLFRGLTIIKERANEKKYNHRHTCPC